LGEQWDCTQKGSISRLGLLQILPLLVFDLGKLLSFNLSQSRCQKIFNASENDPEHWTCLVTVRGIVQNLPRMENKKVEGGVAFCVYLDARSEQ
jgi:hypothetical protein